ncbi:hypothetical protein ARTHRO9V_90025 [Arthrobacter sp. 9V]|nr:hypothetical protein ARTHRO9V_90025 [Arthrobacter sp. 9V]
MWAYAFMMKAAGTRRFQPRPSALISAGNARRRQLGKC